MIIANYLKIFTIRKIRNFYDDDDDDDDDDDSDDDDDDDLSSTSFAFTANLSD